jgi:hypothetical protein
MYQIALGQPHNGTICYGTAQGMFRASLNHTVRVIHEPSSLLAAGFNSIYCQALNLSESGEITHLAFLHGDIAPEDLWIDKLVDEMDRMQADFMSVIVPIKDVRGLTSTGVGRFGMDWSPLKRFTMSEVMELPETFGIGDTIYPGHVLLHNSGCWIADLRNPLFHTEDASGMGLVYFTINDRIVRNGGKWTYQVEPEDWFFSRRLHEQGAKSFVTRKVTVGHCGYFEYRNDHAWGIHKEDEQTRELWDNTEVSCADL